MDTVEKLTTVYTLKDPNEAELVKNLLRDHGIACNLDGEHQAGFTGIFNIGVLVRTEDADRAMRVLKHHHVDE
jgi:hypothetical protein